MATEEKVPEALDQVIEDFSNKMELPATYEPPSPLTGSYLLIILGEPHSQEHKDIILQRLLKGLLSWNVLDCHVDLEEELSNLTNHGPEGEAARHGERLIQFASENLVTEILIHPQYNTLIQCMRNLLSSFTRHRHIIHSGYTFSGNGSWILQDATFSVSDFAEALQDYEVQRVMRAYPDTISMEIHCATTGHWNKLPDKSYAKLCKIHINSVDILDSGSEKLNAFINYLSPLISPAGMNELMESSDVVGNIRFSHPTLYVFPGGQGDAALFGINGFNMLVDGGFNRKSCFWDFTRHLDRLDAVLMTRISNANIQGLSSVIERKAISNVYPQIGYFFTNIPETKAEPSLESDKDSDPLLVNLFERGQSLTSNLKSINLKPQSCYKNMEPINLYHKVGHGTLDMYVISPSKESKEVKEFLQKWNARDQNLFASKQSKEFQFPLQNLVSICAMLVWQPADPEETITRILFPGSTPDYKIIEGLDKMKHLEFVKHPVCTANQIEASFSSTILSKKQLKSALADKSTHEPILPSKQTKTVVAQEKDNKMMSEMKIQSTKIDKEYAVDGEKDDTKLIKSADNEKDNKSVSETKPVIKSRIDSRPPKSMEKKLKKDSSTEKKSSPITTPKKEPKSKEKDIKPKIISRISKSSPSSTPAKSTKEANNRKVFESKQKTMKTIRKEVSQTVEKKEVKEVKEKVERKAISRRPKPAAGSPMKAVKAKATKENAVRKPKQDKPASDSSVLSTASADEAKVEKPVDDDKQIILDDLIEEQEAVREIEAVLKRSEQRNKVVDTELRAIIDKQESTTEADEDEEYIIIEKEEPYTEDSVNEPESTQLTGQEEEIQKHQRDSQESEKKRKPSLETTEEEEEPHQPIENSTEIEQPTAESGATEPVEVQDDEKEAPTAHKMNGHIPKPKVDLHEEIKSDEGSPDADDKQPSDEKKTDAKDDSGVEKGDIKEADGANPPESQATVESGATTAPTLPEDEHITLDEIKEDVVIEEKYIKEETKETQVIVTAATEPTERVQPKPIHFDTQQPHSRELNIKTPDEVADLPMHEEADIAVDETPAGSRKASIAKQESQQTKTEAMKTDEKIVETEQVEIKEDELQLETQTDAEKEKSDVKSPTEKKTPSPTIEKKIDLTKIEPKVSSPVAKVEYKVEELGKQFENTLKDVTGQVELTDKSSDLKEKSPTDDIKPEIQEEEEEEVMQKDDVVERKSASPIDIKQEELIQTDIKTETVKEELKTISPVEQVEKTVETERKDSVVEPSDIKDAATTSKTPSPDAKEEINAVDTEIDAVKVSETVKVSESTKESVTSVEVVSSEISATELKEIEQKIESAEEKVDIGKVSPTKELDEDKEKDGKISVSPVESKIEKEISKSPSPDLKETTTTKDEVNRVSPQTTDENLERKDSVAKSSDVEVEKDTSKTPSPELKEQTSKRTSLVDEPNLKEGTSKVSDQTTADKSKSPSPTKDEPISESRKQSVADKVSSNEIERMTALPVEKETSEIKSVSPAQDEQMTPERKESIVSDKSSPGVLDLHSPQYTEVYDYSHPFDAQQPQELRETHITTVESPIVEKSKLIDLQVIDKTIIETVEDSILNDIKEEDEDRISPPREEFDKAGTSPLDVQFDPPRAASPREQEVFKIVANVAEVLKSEKDITDIIPDFNEDELEKNIMQRVSTPEVFSNITQDSRKSSTVDGEHKESIDSHDLSVSLSEAKTSTTSIDEKEQHEIAEKHQTSIGKDFGDDSQRKESFVSGVLDDSRRESAFSTFSEKDFTKDESTLDRFSRSNSLLELKHDDLDVKSPEIETHSEDVTQIEQPLSTSADKKDERKESTTDEMNMEKETNEMKEILKLEEDNATVQRMLVTTSSEDGGEEIEICAEGTIKFIPSAGTTPEILSGKVTPDVGHDDLNKKISLTKEAVDDLQRRESTMSRTSDRPESVMSHFSDTTEPELKETCSSPEKQIHEKTDDKMSGSSGKSTEPHSDGSSSHGSAEIEGIKTPSDDKEDSVIPKLDAKKSTEKLEEKIDIKPESRTDSVASKQEDSGEKDVVSGKATPSAASRPESSASDKKSDVETVKTPSPPIEIGKKDSIEQPESSDDKHDQATIRTESRSQSIVSVSSEEKVETEETQKSRSQSIASEKQEIVSGKATPADVSRPESSVSDKKGDETVAKTPSPPAQAMRKDSIQSVKDEKPETKLDSRSQSVASLLSEEKVEIIDTQQSRSQSIVSEKQEIISGKATPADVSRPESSVSDTKVDETVAKTPSPPAQDLRKDSIQSVKDEKPETKLDSRSQSVASVLSEEKVEIFDTQQSRSQSIVSEKQEIISGKATPADVSRPESSASGQQIIESTAKSPSPSSDAIRKDSVQSIKDDKDDVKSRSQSVASVMSEEKIEITQKSRTQSIVSEKQEIDSGKVTPADDSRPESKASDKHSELQATKSPSPSIDNDDKLSMEKVDDAKLTGDSVSRAESSASDAKEKEMDEKTKSESRAGSIAGSIDEKEKSLSPPVQGEQKDTSRPASRVSDDKIEPIQQSRSQSIVSEKQEIVSGKATPADVSRPESSASVKNEDIAKSTTSSFEKPDEKIEQKSPSPPIEQKSRSQSVASEKQDIISGEATPAEMSRPESSVSDKKCDEPMIKSSSPQLESAKKDSLEKIDGNVALKSETSRPESQSSDISGQKSPAPSLKDVKTTIATESRSQSVASVVSEEKIETSDEPKSRSQSIIGEKQDIVSGKATPADISRPESSASDKKDDTAKSPTPSVKDEPKPTDSGESRRESVASHVSDSKDIMNKVESQRSSIVSIASEQKDLAGGDQKESSRPVSRLTDDDEKLSKTESTETSEFKTETVIEKTTTIVKSIQESTDKVAKSKDDSDDTELIGMQIATGSTIRGVCDTASEKDVIERDLDDKFDIPELPRKPDATKIMKESRSKSVASISVFGGGKTSQTFELEKVTEASKDDSSLVGSTAKTSDIGSLIEDVKKMDEKFSSKPSGTEKIETIETTTITKEEHTSSADHKLGEQKSSHSSLESTTSDKGSIETVLESGALSSSDTKEQHSFDQLTKEVTSIVSAVSTIKTESKSFRDSDNESLPISDDEAASSQKYSYEDYRFERSNSELSKKSDLDIDESQNDIPPQYGSQEFKSAVTVSSSYAVDPMSASFYGELPSGMDKPITPSTVSTVRTVITKQFDSHHLSGGVSDSSSHKSQETFKTKSDDHKFLDEADLDFDKAMEQHRQVCGTDVMSSITSKYEFSPSKTTTEQLGEASSSFSLTDVKSTKETEKKDETILSAEALARQLEDDLKKAEARVASWGKPLGLPVSMNENPPTPKKERKITSAKLKLNNEKNIQRRGTSPNKSKKITPIYMDLTYVPHNGNSYYSHVEFFKRVRARYYVFSGTEPSRDVYNALLEAKQTWEDQNLEVTIIPTYDTDVLGYWVAENEELLAKYHIDLSPSASRCTINLQDHETCCSAYRLEF